MKYTNEETEQLEKLYLGGKTPIELAAQFNKPIRSIISKLSTLGVYKKEETKKRINKDMIISSIAKNLNINEDVLEGLNRCSTNILTVLDNKIKNKLEGGPR